MGALPCSSPTQSRSPEGFGFGGTGGTVAGPTLSPRFLFRFRELVALYRAGYPPRECTSVPTVSMRIAKVDDVVFVF